MPKREVDKRKTRKALRKLQRAAERAAEAGGSGLTDWEKDFVEGISGRLQKYGSAFRDPGKGRLEEALSQRQTHVVRAIDKKSRKKKAASGGEGEKPQLKRSALKRKAPIGSRRAPRVRDVNEDLEPGPAPGNQPEQRLTPAEKRMALRLIPGGKDR